MKAHADTETTIYNGAYTSTRISRPSREWQSGCIHYNNLRRGTENGRNIQRSRADSQRYALPPAHGCSKINLTKAAEVTVRIRTEKH